MHKSILKVCIIGGHPPRFPTHNRNHLSHSFALSEYAMPPKADWEKYRAPIEDSDQKKEEKIQPLSEDDIAVLKTYVLIH